MTYRELVKLINQHPEFLDQEVYINVPCCGCNDRYCSSRTREIRDVKVEQPCDECKELTINAYS